jgi:hypoxanthine phosphoribosyltransferase
VKKKQPREASIPPVKKKQPRKAKARRAAPKQPRRRAPAPRPRREQPLGAGVGDPFAVKRLGIPAQHSRARPGGQVREISWAHFGDLAQQLAVEIAAGFRPDVILGVVNGGVFIGSALTGPLGAEFHPLKFARQGRLMPVDRLPSLAGKRVLVVDDVSVSGQTLGRGRTLAEKAGALEVRTCALVVRPGRSHPDFFSIETEELVVFGWDYQLQAEGTAGAVDPGDAGV